MFYIINNKRLGSKLLIVFLLNSPVIWGNSYTIYKTLHYRITGPGSVVGIATDYGLDGPAIESRRGERFSATFQTVPEVHPTSYTMGTGSFPWVKSGRGVTLTLHSLLGQWSWKGRAISLLPLRAVRPVQSLSACTGVDFTLPFFITEWQLILLQVLRFKF